ncbi:MAG: hypothetical protein V7679_12530 [Parasphingorhabdus sp.]
MVTALNVDLDVIDGREAAERLANDWENRDWVPDAPTPAWARAAILQFGKIMAEQPAIFRASIKRADQGASTLSPRPFQGIIECLQNADDLGATSLRVAYRNDTRPEMLIVHNGEPVTLAHVGAMLLPWLSTKEDDAEAAGRFGIGQRTLNALGGPIELHASPFHLAMNPDGPKPLNSEANIPRIYDEGNRDTMLVIPLTSKVKKDDIAAAISDLGAESLLFLNSVRELRYTDLEDDSSSVRFAVSVKGVDQIAMEFDGVSCDVSIADVVIAGAKGVQRSTFRRYATRRPVHARQARANKRTGDFTPLGVCIPLNGGFPRGLYDRMPFPGATGLPLGLNAQFDPDAARSTLMRNEWNQSRLKDLGILVGWAALDAFARDPATGWCHVPLASETGGDDDWLDEALLEYIVKASQSILEDNLAFRFNSDPTGLGGLAFEAESLEGLLTEADVETLVPEAIAIPRNARDKAGRWRDVLGELGGAEEVEVYEAIEIIDGDPARGADWYVQFGELAVDSGLITRFLAKQSVLLADGTTTAGPSKTAPWVLVEESSATALAARLGLAKRIDPTYLCKNREKSAFVVQLEKSRLLFPKMDQPADVFSILGRGAASDHDLPPIRLKDIDLIALRDAWAGLTRQRHAELGEKIGRSVAIRSTWIDEKGTRNRGWGRPADIYLPAAIDRETDSFAKAAGRTPGLAWVAPEYGKILKQSAGRSAIGAQKLLSAWGVAREPRLVEPADEVAPYVRDPTPASPVNSEMRTIDQRAAIRAGGTFTHLIDDHWSPDAEAVAHDISRAPVKTRRKRALALLAVLSRGWDKRFADLAVAYPAWAFNGYWHRGPEVRATWLARLAEIKWMPDAGNGQQRPSDLQMRPSLGLPSPSDRTSTIAKMDHQILRSGVLTALGVKAGPTQQDLIDRLRGLCVLPVTKAVTDEVLSIYQLLAASFTDRGDSSPGIRLSPTKFRNAFRAGPNDPGLLLVDDTWMSPEAARRGPHVLGNRRAFAPYIDNLEQLWQTLGIQLPTSADAIAVLKEIAHGKPSSEDHGVVIRALNLIAGSVDEMSPQMRATLRKLPLWTAEGWKTNRPIYAFEGDALLQNAPSDLLVWRPGMTSFDTIERLVELLGVVLLKSGDFRAVSLPAYGIAEGEAFRPAFSRAMALLRQELVRADQALLDGLTVDWDALVTAPVLVDPELSITAEIDGRNALTLPARAHIALEPLSIVVSEPADLGAAEAAGAAIATLFEGDRQKVAWAWAAVWPRATAGEQAKGAVLPKTRIERGNTTARLTQLGRQAAKRTSSKTITSKTTAKMGAKTQTVQVRMLKDLDALTPSSGAIVNQGAAPTGNPIITTRRVKSKPRTFEPARNAGFNTSSRRTVLPPTSDREKLALDAVQRALALDVKQFNDLRATRGVGVDAIDELRQCYEIKMCSGTSFPKDVTLTASEIEAARDDPDFFLVLVAGLEESAGKLRIRFIFDPLRQLDIRVRGDLTLTGADEAEAYEFEFNTVEAEENE